MQHRSFTSGPWRESPNDKHILFRILTFWIPKANPDFEAKLSEVEYFWLEIDDGGQVSREIGFSKSGEPVTAAPVGKNLGIFTDLEGAPKPLGTPVSAADFDLYFSKFVSSTASRKS